MYKVSIGVAAKERKRFDNKDEQQFDCATRAVELYLRKIIEEGEGSLQYQASSMFHPPSAGAFFCKLQQVWSAREVSSTPAAEHRLPCGNACSKVLAGIPFNRMSCFLSDACQCMQHMPYGRDLAFGTGLFVDPW